MAAMHALDLGLETFTAQALDKRRRQKRRNDNDPFVHFERIDSFSYFGQELASSLKQRTDVESFEFAQWWHKRKFTEAIASA
jgi:hypothetical protein